MLPQTFCSELLYKDSDDYNAYDMLIIMNTYILDLRRKIIQNTIQKY